MRVVFSPDGKQYSINATLIEECPGVPPSKPEDQASLLSSYVLNNETLLLAALNETDSKIFNNQIRKDVSELVLETETKMRDLHLFYSCRTKFFSPIERADMAQCGDLPANNLEKYLNKILNPVMNSTKLITETIKASLQSCYQKKIAYDAKFKKTTTKAPVKARPGKMKPKSLVVTVDISLKPCVEEHGCYTLENGDIGMDYSVIGKQLIIGSKEGLELYEKAKRDIDDCFTKKIDRWMSLNCRKYVPDLGSRK